MLPRVWKTFMVPKNNGAMTRILIRDLTQDLMEDTADFYAVNFYRDEAFCIAAGVAENPQAMAEARSFALEMMKDPAFFFIVSCEDKADNITDINGVAMMELVKSTDPLKHPKMKTKEMQKSSDLSRSFYEMCEPFKKLNVPYYCKARHMVVSPECRKLGIGKDILKYSCLKAKALGAPVIGAAMTAYETQNMAARNNWQTVKEVDFQEFGRQNGVTFKNVPSTIKYMILNLNTARL